MPRRPLPLGRVIRLCLAVVLPFALAPDARAQISADALTSALVGLAITTREDARTAATLGTERAGSGIVIDDKGLVLTIGYLTLEADEITVRTGAGKTLPATAVGYSGETGLGLVRIQGESGTRPLSLGDSDALNETEPVLVAGFGGVGAIRPAFVTNRRQFAGPWEYLLERAIFTAPPHPAFGGAGLVDANGLLVGVGYLIVANAGSADAPLPGNMFVPINELKPILADLVAKGRQSTPPRPWLGLYSAEAKGRLFVERVAAGGPAEKAGIESGDILLALAGQPLADMADLYRKVWALGPAGVTVPLTVLQGSGVRQISLTSIDRSKWFRPPRTF